MHRTPKWAEALPPRQTSMRLMAQQCICRFSKASGGCPRETQRSAGIQYPAHSLIPLPERTVEGRILRLSLLQNFNDKKYIFYRPACSCLIGSERYYNLICASSNDRCLQDISANWCDYPRIWCFTFKTVKTGDGNGNLFCDSGFQVNPG